MLFHCFYTSDLSQHFSTDGVPMHLLLEQDFRGEVELCAQVPRSVQASGHGFCFGQKKLRGGDSLQQLDIVPNSKARKGGEGIRAS